MKELTISEVAKRAGMNASAIRYYESMHILPAPRRVSGQRRYHPGILRRLSFIKLAQEVGFSVAEMQIFFNGPAEEATPLTRRWQTLAQQKLSEVDVLIERAHRMKQMLEEGLQCGCLEMDECINCVVQNCQKYRLPHEGKASLPLAQRHEHI